MQPIGVVVLITNSQNLLLCGKRLNSYGAGYYGFPGGRVEVGEPLQQTAIREVQEETGITITNPLFCGVIRETQNKYDFIHFVFHVEISTQAPLLMEPEKCERWEWLKPDKKTVLAAHFAAYQLWVEKNTLIDLHV